MKAILLLICISSVYASQEPYQKKVIFESVRERAVTHYMMEERTKVIHHRMIALNPYMEGESVSLKVFQEYKRLELEQELMMNLLATFKENPLK